MYDPNHLSVSSRRAGIVEHWRSFSLGDLSFSIELCTKISVWSITRLIRWKILPINIVLVEEYHESAVLYRLQLENILQRSIHFIIILSPKPFAFRIPISVFMDPNISLSVLCTIQ